jgi:predicted AAA+ superfamily ATPase
LGHKLENLVFLHERRQKRELYYYIDGHEIDLVSASPEPLRFINVAWSLSDPASLAREREAMEFGAARYAGSEGLLVVHEVPSRRLQRLPFRLVPAWRYLLGK